MPPDLLIERIVFKGNNETLYDESKIAQGKMSEALVEAFTQKGYEIKTLDLEKLSAEDPPLKREFAKLKQRYESLINDKVPVGMGKAPGLGQDEQTVGTEVNRIADLTGADALVFSYARGFVKSKGEKTADFVKALLISAGTLGGATYVAPSSGGQIHISVIDTDNGELLWDNINIFQDQINFTGDSGFKRDVKSIVGPFPKRKKA